MLSTMSSSMGIGTDTLECNLQYSCHCRPCSVAVLVHLCLPPMVCQICNNGERFMVEHILLDCDRFLYKQNPDAWAAYLDFAAQINESCCCATMTGIPANAACHLHLCPDNCRPCIAAHVPVPPNMIYIGCRMCFQLPNHHAAHPIRMGIVCHSQSKRVRGSAMFSLYL